MDALFRFMVQYESLLYIVLSIGALIAFRSLWMAWMEWRSSLFGLEKELSFQKVRSAGALLIMLIMIGLSQFCLVTFIVPFLPSDSLNPTPTAALLQTMSGTLSVDDLTAQASAPLAPEGSVGCTPGQIMISSPLPGAEVQGKVIITGTVNIQNFGFYKYEYTPQGSETWATIAAGDQIKTEAELGAWETSQLVPGDYQLRLLVTDNVGQAMPPCILSVRVMPP